MRKGRGPARPRARNLAALYETGAGVPVDPACAFALYNRACHGGATDACINAAMSMARGVGTPRDVPGAEALLAERCEKGTMARGAR